MLSHVRSDLHGIWWTVLRTRHVERNIGEVEATWSASWTVIVEWKVTVAICVAAGRGDVCRVKDVAVDEISLQSC